MEVEVDEEDEEDDGGVIVVKDEGKGGGGGKKKSGGGRRGSGGSSHTVPGKWLSQHSTPTSPIVMLFPQSKIPLTPTLMYDLNPRLVVIYDPDPMIPRLLEVYSACLTPPWILTVITLTYQHSAEMRKFTAIVQRERDAFLALIEGKRTMAPPIPTSSTMDPPIVPSASSAAAAAGTAAAGGGGGGGNSSEPQPGGTGKDSWGISMEDKGGGFKGLKVGSGGRVVQGGGNVDVNAHPHVIVDMRDFRSKLPSLLHSGGFVIEPCTLEVGDYVLSPTVCVERKSIPDLEGSLASGRLYTQAEHMCRHYKVPVLLIESDNEKEPWFSGGGAGSGSGGSGSGGGGGGYNPAVRGGSFQYTMAMDLKDVRCKLILLLLHFPALRVVWSRSPHATVDVFRMLRDGHPPPDVKVAASLKTDEEGGGGGEALEGGALTHLGAPRLHSKDHQNLTALDILRKLPGVTAASSKVLAGEFLSLAALAKAPLEQLIKLMGPGKGQQLHNFLHKAPPVGGEGGVAR